MSSNTKMKSEEYYEPVLTKSTGHQTLKSSVLSPTSSKLTSQYMVLNNLMVHYKKLEKAKSCIDSAPPKAWLARKKAREKPRSASTRSATVRTSYRSSPVRQDAFSEGDENYDYGATANQPMSMAATSSRLARRDFRDTAARTQSFQTYGDEMDNGWANGSLSAKQREEHEHYVRTGVDKPKYDENDLIIRHANVFSSTQKPFSPRMLQRTAESRLTNMSCYCPPRRSRSKRRADDRSRDVESGQNSTTAFHSNGSRPGTGAGMSDTLANDTLRSFDGRFNKQTPTGVPPLNISLDADHIRWLQEHQVHSSSAKQARSTGNEKAPEKSIQQATSNQTTAKFGKQDGSLNATKRRIGDDDAQKYQEFLAEVTRDILDRGIYTNRGLRQVFESHVQKRNDLKPSKMREMLTELENKLGLPPENQQSPSKSTNDFGYASTLRYAKDSPDDDFGNDNRRPGSRQRFGSPSPGRNDSFGGSPTAAANAGIGRPPRPRPAGSRRDSSGSGGALSLDDFAGGGSPPTPRRQQINRQRLRHSPDVLTIDQDDENLSVSVSMTSASAKKGPDDNDSEGYDEVDASNGQQLGQTITATMHGRAARRAAAGQSTIKPSSPKSGTLTAEESNSGRSELHRKNGIIRKSGKPLPAGHKVLVASNSGRSESPPKRRPAGDDNSSSSSVVTGKSSSVKVTETVKVTGTAGKGHQDAAPNDLGKTLVRKKDDSEAELTAQKLKAVDRSSADETNNQIPETSRSSVAAADEDAEDDENGYESNEELLDTLTTYQQKLEQTIDDDERGTDTEVEEADDTGTKPVAMPRQTKARLSESRDDECPEDDGLDSSVEVSDLDENEIDELK